MLEEILFSVSEARCVAKTLVVSPVTWYAAQKGIWQTLPRLSVSMWQQDRNAQIPFPCTDHSSVRSEMILYADGAQTGSFVAVTTCSRFETRTLLHPLSFEGGVDCLHKGSIWRCPQSQLPFQTSRSSQDMASRTVGALSSQMCLPTCSFSVPPQLSYCLFVLLTCATANCQAEITRFPVVLWLWHAWLVRCVSLALKHALPLLILALHII